MTFKRNLSINRIVFVFLIILLNTSVVQSQGINHWETIVRSYDTWRYIVPSSEPPADWNAAGFDDSAWLSGKGNIGYGEIDDSTILATPVNSLYLRKQFNIVDKSVIAEAILHVDYDDGFVAYLNGHEIARANLGSTGSRQPYNAFAFTTHEAALPAGGTPPGFTIARDTLTKYLLNGSNVLALQVHNASLASSDLSSTTFLSAGITGPDYLYHPLPQWFPAMPGTSSLIPIVSIETNGQIIPDSVKIMASCKVIDNGRGNINDLYDQGTDYNGRIGIEIRGQSSQMFPKKSYSIELRRSESVDTVASLLGMPAGEDWVLHAHYSDKSMMRNAITYYLGSKMGAWQPRFRYCTVFLNGEYIGIYLLLESIKRDSARVNINGLVKTDNYGKEVTGGYIIKRDKNQDLTPDQYFITYPTYMYVPGRYYPFTYVYPKADSLTYQQKSYIQSFMTDFESALNSNFFRDPLYGFRKYIDYGSFVDYQLMQELSNNVDGYVFSTFFYKQKITHGNKLFAGPLWDFDLCYGNVNYSPVNLSTTGWHYPHYANEEGYHMHWWARLMEDPEYSRRFVTRWRELRRGPFRTDSIMYFIDSIKTILGGEIERNFQKWPILGQYVWPNNYVGATYEDEIVYLKSWMNERLNWMDAATGLNSDLFSENFSNNGITVYPIPVKDKLNVIFNLDFPVQTNIELIDLFGKKIFEKVLTPGIGGDQEVIIDMSDFNTGCYILRIRQDTRLIGVKKVIKY